MKGIWLICTLGYTLENGEEIPKGRMDYSYARWASACAPNWRRATQEEIETKKWHKGNYYNLNI